MIFVRQPITIRSADPVSVNSRSWVVPAPVFRLASFGRCRPACCGDWIGDLVHVFRGCDLLICHCSFISLHLNRSSGSDPLTLLSDWFSFSMFRGVRSFDLSLLLSFSSFGRQFGSEPLIRLSDWFSFHNFGGAIF